MANYINITLDTASPQNLTLTLNNGADKTSSTTVNLELGCEEIFAATDSTEYEMKIWGTSLAPTENDAQWETFSSSKSITLVAGDGEKTVYAKVRDDVWNESEVASDTIKLYEKVPVVTDITVSASKISLVNEKNETNGMFVCDEDVDAIRIIIASDINTTYDSPNNKQIPTTNGSFFYHDDHADPYDTQSLAGELESPLMAGSPLFFRILTEDITAVSPGDGVKIIKAFVRSKETGNWSV